MRRSAASAAELLPWATGGLVTAVVAEFLLLRVVNRMADRVPGLRGDAGLGVLFAGTAAMNLALLLGMGFLAAVAVILWERSRVLAALALAAAVTLGLAQLSGAAILVLLAVVAVAVLLATVGGQAVLRALREGRKGLPQAAFLALTLGTFLAAAYLRAGDHAAALGGGPPARTGLYGAGEVLAVLTAIAAAVAFRAPVSRWNLLIPAGTVAVAAVAFSLRPELVPLIAFWSVGFQMSLPIPLYLIALGAYAYAAVNLRAARDPRFLGLLLLALGGRSLGDLYLLAIAAVSVLLLAAPSELSLAALRPWREWFAHVLRRPGFRTPLPSASTPRAKYSIAAPMAQRGSPQTAVVDDPRRRGRRWGDFGNRLLPPSRE